MALAENSLERASARTWLLRVAIVLVLVVVIAGLTVLARNMLSQPDAPKRQVAKIAILPDAPPPPPPPPPREEPPKPSPRDEPKPVQQEQPKPQEVVPPQAPLKMEGAAGTGESPFSAGSVTQDYKGGPPQIGSAASAVASGTSSDRALERFYANSARQLLRDEIERNLRADAGELTATFALWVEPDGRVRRFEVSPSGDPGRDRTMEQALDGASRSLKLPPPGNLAQPMRFRLSVRPQS